MSDRKQTKVVFRVVDEDGGVDVETLWATPVTPDEYELDNSPFYAYSVSWKDVVFAPMDPEEGRPVFQKVVRKSGHRTVRIIFEPPVADGNESDVHLKKLVAMGCSYEGSHHVLMSVDVPPQIELDAVREYLIESDLKWEHSDPTYEELFPNANT
jgi:hypothetical protein